MPDVAVRCVKSCFDTDRFNANKRGKSTEHVGLARVDHPDNEYHRLLSAFDRTEMRAQADGLIPQLNSEQ